MTTQSSFITKVITVGSFAVAAALIAPTSMGFNGFSTNAFAEESHEGSTGHIGTKGGSTKGKGTSSGHGGAESGSGQGGKSTITKGQGGPDASSDGKGPKYGSGGRDGKPIWASEGIDTSVEYGRLNIMRAPQNVRDQALLEALKNQDWDLYAKELSAVITDILNYRADLTVTRIDSPSEALALYQALLKDGKINLVQLATDPVTGTVSIVKDADGNPIITGTLEGDPFVQAAIFLASASDKTKPIYTVTVTTVNKVLGGTTPLVNPINPATGQIATDQEMALAAEYVRRAIEAGHDAVTVATPAPITEPTIEDVTPPVVP